MRVLLAIVALFTLLGAGGAPADDGSAQAIHEVIDRQLQAFRRDDGTGAFSYAAPVIQQQFRTPERFMRMVRRSYDPVYRPAGRSFQETRLLPGRAVQEVLLLDRKGVTWLAHYFMERQADGSWRIAGVSLEQLPDLSA